MVISHPPLATFTPLFLGYVGVFALAALGCLVSLHRVNSIADAEVRRGLWWFLLTCGGWAAAHVGYLAGPTARIQHGFYVTGLVVGIAAVGPWLYFCAAYSGRSFHRDRRVHQVAVLVFLGIVSVKLTNPLHGWYYSTAVVAEPFPHLLVSHEPLHWVVMGLAYALAFVGFFMLFELFFSVDFDVMPLMVLVAITGLPVALDIGGAASQSLLEITYSPLGVSIFAVSVMFVYLEPFQTLNLAGAEDDPVIVLDDQGRIQNVNRAARQLYPDLEESYDEQLASILPEVGARLDASGEVLGVVVDGTPRYYQLTVTPFGGDHSSLGSAVTLTDVSERESYRQELERQNERLEQFASMVSHDLRNPLNVASIRTEAALADREDENLVAATEALDRMEVLIDDLLALARQGQPIDETEAVSLSQVARQAWSMVETGGGELVVESDLQFPADPDRLQQLFENLFRNAWEHGGQDVTVRVGSLGEAGFFVADDGAGIPSGDRDQVFESGYTTAQDGTGFGLTIVREIADAHEWDVAVTESRDGGAQFEITGVRGRAPSEQ